MSTPIASRQNTAGVVFDSNSDPVILLDHAGVSYRISRERVSGFKEFAIRSLQRRMEFDHVAALQGVSLAIKRGEPFGIVGKNGAGKSTLLKLIARVLPPTQGRIRVRGRVAPLLEMGAGFHSELTGRENVYLYGTLLGYSRADINQLFDSIVDFAELWDFIDAPLRTYSTGMVARLAFAVATCSTPEILLVDEVLSVGDADFQKKCLIRMEGFVRDGVTLVLVSHNMSMIRQMCSRAAWLSAGQLMAVGPAQDVVAWYTGEKALPEAR